MKKPIIAITCSEDKSGENDIQKVNESYINAVLKAGGVPILLPICEDQDMILEQTRMIDGLLVTGGIDVDPLFYHENCTSEQGESSTRRDLYEINLIQNVAKMHKPILGICRGLQIINVAFDGSLYQDNTMAGKHIQQHQQKEKRDYPIHSIHIEDNSFLSPIFKNKTFVNSFHHQSIKQIAPQFSVVAKSEDGIIEAIQHNHLPIWAVQFHPEAMCDRNHDMLKIFCSFIKNC